MDAHQKAQFDKSSDEELRNIVEAYIPDRKEHQYCRMLLDLRAQARMENKFHEISDRVGKLDKREWKSLTFWIVLLTLIVAGAALMRDLMGWSYPATMQQEQSTPLMQPTPPPSSGISSPGAARPSLQSTNQPASPDSPTKKNPNKP